jgi:hypothetical protein
MYSNSHLQYSAYCPSYSNNGPFREFGPLGPFWGCYKGEHCCSGNVGECGHSLFVPTEVVLVQEGH